MRNHNGSTRLHDLHQYGQSIWLDELQRRWLDSGDFARMVERDALSGVTTNPTIFAKAFAGDAAYHKEIAQLQSAARSGSEIYERLAVEDIRSAADRLRKTYNRTDACDGFASIEVAPAHAHETEATVSEALRLWKEIARPNVMIKVPATDAGVRAIRQLIAQGVNVNATLIFSVPRYAQVLEAYLLGLEDRVALGQPLHHVAGVASVFVSRIDTLVDKLLSGVHEDQQLRAKALRGSAAIAVARMTYQHFKKVIATPRWEALAARHAQPQRPLWASTGTKDPSFSDVKYVDALIGPGTVTTVPSATLDAFRDHGAAAPTLEKDLPIMATIPATLQSLGIDLHEVGRQLEREGLKAFAASMDSLLAALATKRSA